MTKRELEKIRNLNGVIKIYQKELDMLRCKSLVKGQIITDMPFGSGTSDKTADTAIEIAEYNRMIDGTLAEMQINRRKIMTYIDGIDDNLLKQIYYYWCICVMSWNEVANTIGGRNSEDSVKKIYYRSFEKA